jgi:hypothetical protein
VHQKTKVLNAIRQSVVGRRDTRSMEVFQLHAHRNGAAIRAVRRKKVRKAESLLRFLYRHQDRPPVRLLSGFDQQKASFLQCHK